MKNIVKIYILIGSVMMLASCSKILDAPAESTITSANYWKAEGDVAGYMTGIYSEFRLLMNSTYHYEDRGDAFVAGLEGAVSSAWEQNLKDENAPSWLDFYNIVHHCNLVLKYAPGITFGNQQKKDRLIAEASFIRAYVYFLLTRSWGKVPIVLEPTETDDSPFPARAPETEVMTLILADLNKAISLFPENGFITKYKASKPAALALKADVLLWKKKVLKGPDQDLEDAITSIDQASAGLKLQDNFEQIFATDQRNNPEIIFSLRFVRDEKSDQYGSRMKPRDIFVSSAINKDLVPFAKNGARSVYSPSPKLEAMFNKNVNDKRKNASVIKAIDASNKLIGTFDNKFRGTLFADDRFYDNDIILSRLGGLLLLKAEALAALNRIPDAIKELNKVRVRAGTGDYTGAQTKQVVEKEILDERMRELYFELTRWPDLVRFHSGGTIDIYTEVPNLAGKTVPLYFPIPRAQIDINKNLVQTDGYK